MAEFYGNLLIERNYQKLVEDPTLVGDSSTGDFVTGILLYLLLDLLPVVGLEVNGSGSLQRSWNNVSTTNKQQ